MKLLTLLAALVLTACYAPSEAQASPPEVIAIGDSITCMSADSLHADEPKWLVDCRNGRKVATLHERVQADLAVYGAPRVMVLALGQNESAGWTRDDYERAVDMVPSSTKVVLVTTYRDPMQFGVERSLEQARYSRWMRDIADERERVTVADWRTLVLEGDVRLIDGSHPDDAGRRAWAKMIEDGVYNAAGV